MKKVLYFIIPLIIGVVFAFGLNKFLDYKINNLYKSKNLVPLMDEYSSNTKDKGVLINNHFLENGDIMMLGSSELRHATKQHPSRYFNTNRSKDKVFIIGRPSTEELQDTITLGSTDPNIKDKKVVLLVSLQWFVHKNGVSKNDFQGRFSPVQMYTFLNNPKISKKNKEHLCKRLNTLLKGSDEYASERLYARLYNSHTTLAKVEKVLLKPYFKFREKMVILKEKGMLYRKLEKLPNKSENYDKLGKPIDWKKENEIAIKDAKKRVKDNKLKIDKAYYNKTLKPRWNKLKDRYAKANLLKSEELNDYKYFLRVCENLGVKPTIVIMPVAPWYYDYTGVPKAERYKFYDTIEKLAKEKGFNVMNLKNEENTEYYLRDIMHLGTKGWLDVSERLYKQYNEAQVFNK